MSERTEALKAQLKGAEQKQLLEHEINTEILAVMEKTEKLFAGEQPGQTVLPTLSPEGIPRLRMMVLDEDAGAGYLEGTKWLGMALLPDGKLIGEVHFPLGRNKQTVFYTFDTNDGTLSKHTETADTRGEKPLEGMAELEGAEKLQGLKGLEWYFVLFGERRPLLYEGDRFPVREKYEFETEALKG